ncbi:uncharacterized protein LOC144104335 isoform X2 [Amblyomma americanum]
MTTVVKYKDLPGGPTEVKFADEISRHCLCGQCGMISKSMYKDPQGHVFCEACLLAQSIQYDKYYIYCQYEKKNIDIHEMEQAFDLLTVLRDQYVDCPNRERCGQQVRFEVLKDHYITCQTEVKCSKCGTKVRSTEWDEHNCSCSRRVDDGAASKKASTTRQAERKPPLPASSNPDVLAVDATAKLKNSSAGTKQLYPSDQLKEATKSTPGFTHGQQVGASGNEAWSTNQAIPQPSASDGTVECPYCFRKVKGTNMGRHLSACSKSPVSCAYCHNNVKKEDKMMHEEQCKSNPQNKPKEVPSIAKEKSPPPRSKEMDRRKGASSSSPESSKQRKSNANVRNRLEGSLSKPSTSGSSSSQNKRNPKDTQPQRNNGPTTEPPKKQKKSKTSKTTDEKCTSVEDSSSVAPAVSQDIQTSSKDEPWLPYLSAGDWTTAFVVMEECIEAEKDKEIVKYDHLVGALMKLNLHEFVSDLMTDPSNTHPFSCLVTALLARVWLKEHLRARREKVTWENVLDYMPSVLKARLTKTARSYLNKYQVFGVNGPSIKKGEVKENATGENAPVSHASCSSRDLQTAQSSTEDPRPCEKPSEDTSGLIDKNMQVQTPDADITFRRADIHHRLLEMSGGNVAGILSERGEVKKAGNEKVQEMTDGSEAFKNASENSCEDSISTNSGPDRELHSASPDHLSTKEQKPDATKELSEHTAIERIIFEMLGRNGSVLWHKGGADSEVIEVAEVPTASIQACDTPHQEFAPENSASHKEVVTFSSRYAECMNGSLLSSREGDAPEKSAVLTDRQADDNYETAGMMKCDINIGDKEERESASTGAVAAHQVDQDAYDQLPTFTQGHLEMAGARSEPHESNSSHTPSSHELETSCSDYSTARSSHLVTLTDAHGSDRARSDYASKMRVKEERKQNRLLYAPAQTDYSHSHANCHAPYSKFYHPGPSGTLSQDARKRVLNDEGESSVAMTDQFRTSLRDDGVQAHCLEQADYGSCNKTPEQSRYQSHLDSSATGDRTSKGACLNSQSEQDKPSEPNGSRRVSTAEKLSRKELPSRVDGETAQHDTNRFDGGRSIASSKKQHESGEKTDKDVACPGLSAVSLATFDRLRPALKSRDSALPNHRTLRANIVKSSKRPSSASCIGDCEAGTKVASSQENLDTEHRCLCSRSQGCMECVSDKCQRTAIQASTVEALPTGGKILKPKTGTAAVALRKTPFEEGASIPHGGHKSANALQLSQNRFQVDIPSSKCLDAQTCFNSPRRERYLSDSRHTVQSEAVPQSYRGVDPCKERSTKKENRRRSR